jgi:hypothetical protein
MTPETLKLQVKAILTETFPGYHIQLDQLSENPGDLGVSVYGVVPQVMRRVKDKILDLDEEFCTNTTYCLVPLVRNLETTQRYYPQYLSSAQKPSIA